MLFITNPISKFIHKTYPNLVRRCSSGLPLSDPKLGNIGKRNVKNILKNGQENQEVRFQGWVRSLRKQKQFVFLDVNDGSTINRIPIVVPSSKAPKSLSLHSTVDIKGVLVRSPKNPEILEVSPTEVNVLGPCDQTTYPFGGKTNFSAEHIRHFVHLRPKTNKFSSLLRLRSELTKSISDFFYQNEFIQIHTPILTTNDCEGAGETFCIRPNNEELLNLMKKRPPKDPKEEFQEQELEDIFFDKRTFLSVSSQLHLESAVRGLEKVWTISPVFRAENQISTRHLSEFYMVEAEIAFAFDIVDILEIMEKMVKFTIRSLIEDHNKEWEYFMKLNFEAEEIQEHKELLSKIVKSPFTMLTFDQAKSILKEKLDSIVSPGKGLSREQELLLVQQNDNIPIFVIDWPSEIKPFYMRQLPSDSTKVSAVDLLVPMVGELCGGSLREDNLEKIIDNLSKCDPDGKISSSLEWYFDLKRYGNVPSGGFGLGLERLLQLILKCGNIKDVSFVPRSPHNCPM